MTDNGRSAECLRQFTEGGPSGCAVYETIHWVLVAVQQSSVLVAVQQSTPTLEAGGNTLLSPGSPFMPDESDRIGTVTDRISTATGRIGTHTSSLSEVDQPCLDLQTTCCKVVRRRSFSVPHSLLVVDLSCGHHWCLCCRQMEQSWRMWWTVFSTSLQSQSAESIMPIHFRCVHRPQCPVHNLNIVVCSCLARWLIGSVEEL